MEDESPDPVKDGWITLERLARILEKTRHNARRWAERRNLTIQNLCNVLPH